jgi:quinol monooxygenase YgiN
MIIGRFKARCGPDRDEELAAAIAAVEMPSRELPGVVHFDVARSLTEPNTFVVTEVFDDREALARQNAQPEVARVLDLVDVYEWTVWEGEPDQ